MLSVEVAKKMGKLEAYILQLTEGPKREMVIVAYLELVDAIGLETDFAQVAKEKITD